MLQASIERTEAIDLVRSELLKHTDSETSACKYASERGVFCRGFVRFSDSELRRKFGWITRRRPDMTREELEVMANRWQLARQEVNALPLACDVQQTEHDMCRGWDDFSNDELSRVYTELTGKTIVVA
jgi:hypothetical protein